MGNYKTAASASAAWAVIKKKLLAKNTSQPQSTAETTAGGVGGNNDDDGSPKFTPINTPETKKPGKKRIKAEENDGEEVKPVSTPSKKRVRKAKEDPQTPSKRTKTAVTNTSTAASVISGHDEIPSTATISPTQEDTSHDLIKMETPSEEAQNGQGD